MTARQHFIESVVEPYRADASGNLICMSNGTFSTGDKIAKAFAIRANLAWRKDKLQSSEIRHWWNKLSNHERLRLQRVPPWLLENPPETCKQSFPTVVSVMRMPLSHILVVIPSTGKSGPILTRTVFKNP